jgi:hypothetical protein
MKISKSISIELKDEEIKLFFSIIDKVEKHRVNEGKYLTLPPKEADMIVNIYYSGFDSGYIKEG